MKNRAKNLWKRYPEHGLQQYLPSGVFFLHRMVNGTRLRSSLETTNLEVACRKRDQIIAGYRAGRPDSHLTLAECCASQEERLRRSGNKPRAIDYNLQCLAGLRKTFPWPEEDARSITREQCEKWAAGQRAKFSPTRFNGMLWQLRAVFELAIENGCRLDNPAAHVRMSPVPAQKADLWLPSSAQFDALVQFVRTRPCGLRQERADYLLFLRWTGLRVSEAAHLRKADVDLIRQQINLPGAITKNSRPRSVPIFAPIQVIVTRWVHTQWPAVALGKLEGKSRPAECLCPVWNIKEGLKRACAHLGFPVRLSHHDFRHLFITHWLEQGVPPHNIAKWVGHLDNGKLILATYTTVRDSVEKDLVARLNRLLEEPENLVTLPKAAGL